MDNQNNSSQTSEKETTETVVENDGDKTTETTETESEKTTEDEKTSE